MNKHFNLPRMAIFCVILVMTGCQKNTNPEDPSFSEEPTASDLQPGSNGNCRLTEYDYYDGVSDYHNIEHVSFKENGFVDEWTTPFGIVFKMDYNIKGQLKTAMGYENDVLVYTVQFEYQENRVVRETWYQGNTDVIDDVVEYSYNLKGQMIKNISHNYDYYTTYTYTASNDVKSWFFFVGDTPAVKGEYTYTGSVKNPFKTWKGISHNFPYANPAFASTERWYISEKITLYDEDGNPLVLYDQDPSQTTWETGHEHLPTRINYVDIQTGTAMYDGFEYENCKGNSPVNPAHSITQKSIKKDITEAVSPGYHPGTHLLRLPKYPIRKQILDLQKAIRPH